MPIPPLHLIIELDIKEAAVQKVPPLIGQENDRDDALLESRASLVRPSDTLERLHRQIHTYNVACDRTRTAEIGKT